MDVYFSPLACSLASRIAFYEAGATATFIEVDPKTKRTLSGDDYLGINPLGLVPALRTDDGEVLLENAAILQYIADRHPTKVKTLETGARRIAYLARHLGAQPYLLEAYTVADSYLTAVLNWTIATPVDLKPWPALAAYFKRMSTRPATARAMREEFALYAEEQKRHQQLAART